MEALGSSIFHLYDSRLWVYREWCIVCQISLASTSVGGVSGFLTHLSSLGGQVNTLKVYPTSNHKGFPDDWSRPLDLLIWAMALKRPHVQFSTPQWDMLAVLCMLCPSNHALSVPY